MDSFFSHFTLKVNPSIYLKDPETSKLGKRIIEGSINLIDAFGFDNFTFKKLADEIDSTESSIYRYFENKHKLLLYLTSWYWAWLESHLLYNIINVEDNKEQLKRAIRILTKKVEEDGSFSHINEIKLNQIIITESSKSYMHKDVDVENKEGAFLGYKSIVAKVAEIIIVINPKYKYPNMLISTIIEGAHHQRFFQDHLPRLSNNYKDEDTVSDFYAEMVLKVIG
ncbi:MAG: TetR/AcrR family transcriptional regulator [Crocinitomicaceae bacterium]|nr:TetR/AcrR family transcriptional regulator [Crocinitomicaceae bacterium]